MARLRLVALAAVVLVLASLIVISANRPALAVGSQIRTFVASTGADANPCSRVAPCRMFAAALAQTASGGEVIALDTAGYGTLTITQSVTITAAPGVQAFIAPSSGAAITVNAGGSDVVVLRNLQLRGLGGNYGVDFFSGGVLHVEHLLIEGFSNLGTAGIVVHAPDSETYISDTILRENSDGLDIDPFSGTASAFITRVQAVNNIWDGFVVFGDSRVVIRDSAAAGSFYGLSAVASHAGTAQVSIEHSTFSGNTNVGIRVGGGDGAAIVDVSNSTISYNGVGVGIESGGAAYSRVNNTLERNGTDGTFTGSIAAK